MFVRLRWLSVVIPVVVVAGIELLSDTLFDPVLPFPVDALLVAAAVLVAALILSTLAFGEIDRLTSAVEAQNAELMARTATARSLEEVAVDVARGGALEPTLARVVERARDLLHADVAALETTGAGAARHRIVRPVGALPIREPGGTNEASEVTSEAALVEAGFEARLVTPLRLGADELGTLSIADHSPRVFDVDAVETISALAGLAGVAIRNEQLRDSMRALAERTERERIAGEMHDGLAQVLAYVSTKTAAAAELLAGGHVDEAAAQMAELSRVARSTYVDVREAILGLSTPVTREAGLAGAIETYASRFAEAAKVVVSVNVADAARTADVAPQAQAQTFRIVQEALTNVRKHANAARVWIRMDADSSGLQIVVRDDGRGMAASDETSPDWPRYGLSTMAARAADVGGTVTVTSPAGGGTCVQIEIPTSSSGHGEASRDLAAPAAGSGAT